MDQNKFPKLGKDLKQLSTMLNRKKNSAFRSDLRNQLLNQANVMNTKKNPSGKGFKNPFRFLTFKWTLVPVTAMILIGIIVMNTFLPGGGSGTISQLTNIAEAKAYYSLEPVKEDESGINKDTEFVLSSKGEIDPTEIKENLAITPETKVSVKQKDANSVIIKPSGSLQKGEVYTIALAAQNIEESPYRRQYSWAYQVSDEFKVIGTVPGDKRVGIPIDTGIEIKINSYGVTEENFRNSFTISPDLPGEFIVDGKVLIFAPGQDLKKETIYTITLDKTLTASGEEESLSEDYIFQFETADSKKNEDWITFGQPYFENSPDNEPVFTIQHFSKTYQDRGQGTVHLAVYQYPSHDAYYTDVKKKEKLVPVWSQRARRRVALNTDSLTKVVDVPELGMTEGEHGRLYLLLPDKLPKGHYIIEAKLGENTIQSFLQVTHVAAQININSSKPFVWINSTLTGEPIKGARAEMMNDQIIATSDKDGVALFKKLPEISSEESAASPNYMKIEADGEVIYHYAPLKNPNPYHREFFAPNEYFKYLETDRKVYHPTDRIYYWGFLQGRKKEAKGEATVVIFDDNVWPTIGQKIEDENQDQILYKNSLKLKDGEVFEGKFEIEKLIPRYSRGYGGYGVSYTLAVLINNEVVSKKGFMVNDFVKPAYQINMEAEENVIFNGQSTKVKVQSEFFDGTKVANTALSYGYTYETNRGELETDEQGEAVIPFDQKMRACRYEKAIGKMCNLFETVAVTAHPKNEELAEISGLQKIHLVRSGVGAIVKERSHDNVVLQTKKVSFDAISEMTYASEYNKNTLDEIAPNTKIDLRIVQESWKKEETGQYYDPVAKIMRKQYKSKVVYKELEPQVLLTDEKGMVSFDPHLNPEETYLLYAQIYDKQGRSYTKKIWIGESGSWNVGYQWENLRDREEFVPGDTVTAKVVNDEKTEEELKENSYLFTHGQYEIDEIITQNDPKFTTLFKEESVPNINIDAYIFDGKHYYDLYPYSANFDKEIKRLQVDIKADKEVYYPGEKVNIQVHTTEKTTGKNVSSDVNLYLVDEAYYALYAEGFSDPLSKLYSHVSPEQAYTYSSHKSDGMMADGGMGGCFVAGTQILMTDGTTKSIEEIKKGDQILTRQNPLMEELAEGRVVSTQEHIVNEYLLINGFLGVTAEHIIFLNGQFNLAGKAKVGDHLVNSEGEIIIIESVKKIQKQVAVYNFEVEKYHTYFADGVYVHNDKGDPREDFKDTAVFKVVKTDGQGEASIEFELPDNITSWRMAAGAIRGGDIMAGYGSGKIPVTKDIFALPLINPEYLSGDKPAIPVRAYGDGLRAGQAVVFGMNSKTIDLEELKEGEAFKPTYFEIDKLPLGEHKISTSVLSGKEVSIPEPEEIDDIIILSTEVKETHMTKRSMWEAILNEDTALEGSSENRTSVFFSNNEVGPIYGTLSHIAYQSIARSDAEAAGVVARKWMNKYLEGDFVPGEIKPELYQNAEGISVMPYADTDLKMTALLAVLEADLWNTRGLQKYFENVIKDKESSLTEKIQALYGLSALDEKDVPMLNYFVKNHELSIEDKIYAALTYINYGANSKAEDLFIELLDSSEEVVGKKLKITSENAGLYDERSWTALTAAIASNLGSNKRDALWAYASSYSKEKTDLTMLEQMIYLGSRLGQDINAEVTFKLNGKQINLKGWRYHKLNLLPKELSSQSFADIQGEVYVHTHFEESADLESFKTDTRIKIKRSYLVDGKETTTFKPGDIVKILIKVTVPTELSGRYQVRDYLPSGLKLATYQGHRKSNYKNPYQANDQQINFSQYCGDNDDKPELRCDRGDEFYYFARVINKGEFITEPAILQHPKDESILNLSGKERGMIKIQ